MDYNLFANSSIVQEAKGSSLTDFIVSRMFLMEDSHTISEEYEYIEYIQSLVEVYENMGHNAGRLYLDFLYCLINKRNLDWIWDKENIHWGVQWTLKRVEHITKHYYSKLKEYPAELEQFQLTLFDVMKKSEHQLAERSWNSIYNYGNIPYMDNDSVKKWIYIFDRIDSEWKKNAYDNYQIWIRGDNEPPE
tara:strand:+ start:117 stop:689 length:573 start_codon:yes stop_codon:yes gene_type:complete